MDEALSKLYGVQFFFSAITGTLNHARKKKQEKSEDLTSQEKEEGNKSQANRDLDDFFVNFNPGVAFPGTSLPTLAQLNVIQTLSLPCWIT